MMNSEWQEVTLGQICEFKYGKSLPAAERVPGAIGVYGSNGLVGTHSSALTNGPTIVIGRKGSFGEIAYSEGSCWPIDTTYYVDSSCTNADLRWLYHRLSSLGLKELNRAAAVPGLNREDAYGRRLLLPPVKEQRRIAELLDRADELLAKRRRSMALHNELALSVFHGMFGNGGAAGPLEPLSAHLIKDARNGISPSKGGSVENLVLTLSAITGGSFDGAAAKRGTFKVRPPASKQVDRRDFLVCRGNGNLNLVGLGSFPDDDMPEVVFPDTMIALRVDPAVIDREYLEYVWCTRPVRAQIEAGARTTNGTFKINQGVVESILLPVPRIEDQEAFGKRIRTIKALQGQQSRELTKLSELFASLQARAFCGEL